MLRLRLWLRLWRYARYKALDALSDEFPTEVRSAKMDFYEVFGPKLHARPRVLNAQGRLAQDYALWDAWEDLLSAQRRLLRERKQQLQDARRPL